VLTLLVRSAQAGIRIRNGGAKAASLARLDACLHGNDEGGAA